MPDGVECMFRVVGERDVLCKIGFEEEGEVVIPMTEEANPIVKILEEQHEGDSVISLDDVALWYSDGLQRKRGLLHYTGCTRSADRHVHRFVSHNPLSLVRSLLDSRDRSARSREKCCNVDISPL